MAVKAVLRINLSGAASDPTVEADRYQAAIEMAAMADAGGFAIVNVEEHHDAEIGWLVVITAGDGRDDRQSHSASDGSRQCLAWHAL